MPDHLAALGIGSCSQEERESQIRRILSEAQRYSTRSDSLTLRWSDPSGAELWIYVDSSGRLVSVQPHFAGGFCFSLELQARIARPDVSPFDGGFVGWFGPEGLSPTAGGMPVVFDAPDFVDMDDLDLPSRREVEVVGFAVEVNAFESEAALREGQPDLKPLTFPAYIPAGLIGAVADVPPTAHALLVGRVLLAKRVRNQLTGGEFVRLQVETPADPMDIVADLSLVPELPEAGAFVQVGVWVSGRILPEAMRA